MMLFEIIRKIAFYNTSIDRIGSDVPSTHWKLSSRKFIKKLCEKGFNKFSGSSEIGSEAYLDVRSTLEIGNYLIANLAFRLYWESASLFNSIEDDVMLAPGVYIYINNNNFDRLDIFFIDQDYYSDDAVTIKKENRIGTNVILLLGVTNGKNTVIAGAVVRDLILSTVVVAGNPARF